MTALNEIARQPLPRCICITGPTACGKTRLALALAREFPAEIVSMDSAMVYRGMDIGTDKPDIETRAQIAHHLIDVREPEDAYSAGSFAADAARAIRDIQSRGKLAIVAGGTLLYLRALREGLADLPGRDEAIRTEIDLEAAERGWPAMHARLASVDPAAAARIDIADRQRIQRALEVFRITGRPLSDLQTETAEMPGLDIRTLALVPSDRGGLRTRIEQRFREMIAAGFVDEVRGLMARPGLTADASSMRAVGYRQIWTYLDAQCTWEAAVDRAIIATRQLAKRQMTWLRTDRRSAKLQAEDPGLFRALCAEVRQILDA